ncbi:helix-turn-helix transcriptional regulator [Streptomyces corynorhini]|uniref:helix-turn-helix transcriptional regulator n=1 Tax=Streptomyces corynorhini TaxID=2282652 RepID=UPI0013146BF7|nr:helix-turn-helix transcriptional regulator [Streptomyces corynorhini]
MSGRWLVPDVLRDYDLMILAGLARGQSLPEVAAAAGLATGTLRNRTREMRMRIGAACSAQAVAVAYQQGWMAGLAPEPAPDAAPSGQQRRVLVMLAEGLTNEQIGRRLNITSLTVSSYLRRLYAAMGTARPGRSSAAARAHTVALAYQHGHLTTTSTTTRSSS